MKSSLLKFYKLGKDGKEILNPGLVFILSVASGVTVANLYWAQPLLDTIAVTFGSSASAAGMIVTFTQIGYALGLIFLVPLGDLLERRKLIFTILLITVAVLILAAVSPTIISFLISSLIIGVSSVVAQILVPFAASLAKDYERGKVVGQVMSGLLLGILLARTLAGFISELAGWRAVFVIASILILILSFILRIFLPEYKISVPLSYFRTSTLGLQIIQRRKTPAQAVSLRRIGFCYVQRALDKSNFSACRSGL